VKARLKLSKNSIRKYFATEFGIDWN